MALGWRREYARYKLFFLNIVTLYKQKEGLRMFLEILLSLVTISFFAAFALRPTALTIATLLKDIRSKEETLAKMEQKIKNLEIAQGILESESANLPMIHSAVSTPPQPDVFSRQIEGLAAKNAVTILGISLGESVLLGKSPPPKTAKELTPLPKNALAMEFSLSARGTYQNLLDFLKQMENLRIPTLTDSLGLNLAKLPEETILTLVVSGRTPYLGAESEK